MAVLIVIALILLAAVALRALAQFAQIRSLPLYLIIPLCLSVYLPMSTIILVPADLIPGNFGLSEHVRQVLWRVIYWLAFALSWVILPSLQYYVESGYHDPVQRLKDALKANLRYQLIVGALAVSGLIYMGLSIGLSPTNLRALAVALSYSYALVLVIWLLGHGLISLPRSVWSESDPQEQLNSLYVHSTAVYEAYNDALINYIDVADQVKNLAPSTSSEFGEWIEQLKEDIENSNLPANRRSIGRSAGSSTFDLTEPNLAALSRQLYRELGRATRSKADWMRLVNDVLYLEDIIQAKNQGRLSFRLFVPRLNPDLCYAYYVASRPWIAKTLALSFAILTGIILQSELWLGSSWASIDILVRSCSGFLQLVVACTILGYMCMATGFALSSIRIFHIYGLVYAHTDPSSLTFYAMYACRLAIPLSYNFLAMNTGHTNTVFQTLLGSSINLTPLGRYFNYALPRLILIPMALAFFRLYDKAKNFLGFGLENFGDDESAPNTIAEGKQLILRAINDPSLGLEIRQGDNLV